MPPHVLSATLSGSVARRPSEVRPVLRGRHVVVGPQQQAQAVRPGAPARGLATVSVDVAGDRCRGVRPARQRHRPGAAVDGCDRRPLPQWGRRCGPHGGLRRGPAHRPPHPERADVPARAGWLPAISCAACVLLRWGCPVSPSGPRVCARPHPFPSPCPLPAVHRSRAGVVAVPDPGSLPPTTVSRTCLPSACGTPSLQPPDNSSHRRYGAPGKGSSPQMACLQGAR